MTKNTSVFFKSHDRGNEKTHEDIQPGPVTTMFVLYCSFPALCSDQSHLLSVSPCSFILLWFLFWNAFRFPKASHFLPARRTRLKDEDFSVFSSRNFCLLSAVVVYSFPIFVSSFMFIRARDSTVFPHSFITTGRGEAVNLSNLCSLSSFRVHQTFVSLFRYLLAFFALVKLKNYLFKTLIFLRFPNLYFSSVL